MKKLTKNETKKLMGGVPPGGITRKLWSCLVEVGTPWFDGVCYSVQPQGPCHYPQPCVEIGTCKSVRDMCIY